MKLSGPMKRELFRIARASIGRGHRGARRLGHKSTYRALVRRGLVDRDFTRYGHGVRRVTWLTPHGRRIVKSLGLFLVLLAFAVGCTQLSVTPDVTGTKVANVEASTFGSGDMEVTVDKDGDMTVDMASDGTNIMSIFTGLFKTAARFFGGGAEAPVVNVYGSQPQVLNVPTPTSPPVVPKRIDTSSTPGALTD